MQMVQYAQMRIFKKRIFPRIDNMPSRRQMGTDWRVQYPRNTSRAAKSTSAGALTASSGN